MVVLSAMSDGALFQAARAIVIYERQANTAGIAARPWDDDEEEEGNTPRQAFATVHPIAYPDTAGTGTLPVIGPGVCLSHAVLETLVKSLFRDQAGVRSVLPETVLFSDRACLAWYKPSHVAPIYFAARDDKFTRRMNAKRVVHPALLFVAVEGQLSVFALAQTGRPGDDTPLFVAPYFNVYDSGVMCRGNTLYPPDLSPRHIGTWEQAFFQTQFTHSNSARAKLTAHKDGHNGLWMEMESRASDPGESVTFPDTLLIPSMIGFSGQERRRTVRDALAMTRGREI